MLTQAYYKGKQKSSAIPAYNTHTNGKLDAKAFCFHFPLSFSVFTECSSKFCELTAQESFSPVQNDSESVRKYSQHVISEAVESFNAYTSATKAPLHEPVFSEETKRK